MAYKKYIKKGEKIYGPYIYHSRRIDGKVISEYRGPEKLSYKKIFLAVFGVIFLAALIFILIFSEREITGKVILDLDAYYQQGNPLEGKLRLSLQEGELIPASSKLVFENNGNIFEYNLKDLISEELNEGSFYIKGASISGSGEGYGIPGGREISPTVYFVLSILSEEKPDAEQTGEPETTEPSQTETTETSQTENITKEEADIIETENITEPAETETTETEETTKEETQNISITGNVISRFAGAISNFFLGLEMTGKAVVEFEREIHGQVSPSETFIYTLHEGERVEIKPRSVRTDSKQLSDNDIELKIEGNEVIVTTNYSETGEGFGEDYLGSRSKEIIIDISNLDLILEQGNLKVSLVDSGQEIISLSTLLEEGRVSANETISEEPVSEITEPDVTNETGYEIEETEIYVPELILSLTEQERAILVEKFGNTLKVKEALPKRGFIKVIYEFSPEYSVEFNFDANLSREVLESFMDKKRTGWLKDIAKSLLEEPEPEEEFKEYTEDIFNET